MVYIHCKFLQLMEDKTLNAEKAVVFIYALQWDNCSSVVRSH